MNTKRLNKLWGALICLKFGGKCAVCGRDGCDPHHLIKRNTNGLKFKFHRMNGVWMCRLCHGKYENNVTGLLQFLSDEQVSWYLDNVNNKKFEYQDWPETELELKRELVELKSE